ncbi:MAG TPA: hypothetical protein VD970_03560 [Acetobacteraceae bacterium]|nr:hypothetical protein [Acetobacteraceae bacterium]
MAQLRALETRAAEGLFSEAVLERRRAASLAAEAAARLAEEPVSAAPVTYGTWLEQQLARRQEARAREAAAAEREERLRESLVEARRAQRVVEMLREERREARLRKDILREAAALDEVAGRANRTAGP